MSNQYQISYDSEYGYVYASLIDQVTGNPVEFDTFTVDPYKAKAFAEGYSEALNSLEDTESEIVRVWSTEECLDDQLPEESRKRVALFGGIKE